MASEDVSNYISIGQAIWGVLVAAASFGGLVTWARINIKNLKESSNKQSQEIEDLGNKIQFIRENWVTEDKLEKLLNQHTENTVNKVLVAINAERRGSPR